MNFSKTTFLGNKTKWRPATIINTEQIRKALRVGKYKKSNHEKVFS